MKQLQSSKQHFNIKSSITIRNKIGIILALFITQIFFIFYHILFFLFITDLFNLQIPSFIVCFFLLMCMIFILYIKFKVLVLRISKISIDNKKLDFKFKFINIKLFLFFVLLIFIRTFLTFLLLIFFGATIISQPNSYDANYSPNNPSMLEYAIRYYIIYKIIGALTISIYKAFFYKIIIQNLSTGKVSFSKTRFLTLYIFHLKSAILSIISLGCYNIFNINKYNESLIAVCKPVNNYANSKDKIKGKEKG